MPSRGGVSGARRHGFGFKCQTAQALRQTAKSSLTGLRLKVFAYKASLTRLGGYVARGHTIAISPPICASFAVNLPPSENRGRRECRAPAAPAASRVVYKK